MKTHKKQTVVMLFAAAIALGVIFTLSSFSNTSPQKYMPGPNQHTISKNQLM